MLLVENVKFTMHLNQQCLLPPKLTHMPCWHHHLNIDDKYGGNLQLMITNFHIDIDVNL
jgi:hypothetical protein